jgi:spore coat polysaccharide biosynthesis protein SpsF
MRPTAIIQARVGSSRLPGKVLRPLVSGRNVLEYAIARCRLSQRLADVTIATTVSANDDEVARVAERNGVRVYRGSERDVLDRYVGAMHRFGADPVVRLTADSPLLASANIDEVIASYQTVPADYVCVEGYPLGLGIAECVSAAAVLRAHAATGPDEDYYREHVTTYIIDNPGLFALRITAPQPALNRPELRLTIDEAPDLEAARRVAGHFAPRIDYTIAETIAFLDAHPEVRALNAHVHQRSHEAIRRTDAS